MNEFLEFNITEGLQLRLLLQRIKFNLMQKAIRISPESILSQMNRYPFAPVLRRNYETVSEDAQLNS